MFYQAECLSCGVFDINSELKYIKQDAYLRALLMNEPVIIYKCENGQRKRAWCELPMRAVPLSPEAKRLVKRRDVRGFDGFVITDGLFDAFGDACTADETDALRECVNSATSVYPTHWPADRKADVRDWKADNRHDFLQWSLRAEKLTRDWLR